MKTKILIPVIALMLCSCAQKEDPRISWLESKLASQQLILDQQQTNLMAIATALRHTYEFARSTRELTSTMASRLETVWQAATNDHWRLDEILDKPEVSSLPRWRAVMPTAVADTIRANAKKQWPGENRLQLYEINKQTEAWHRLNDK